MINVPSAVLTELKSNPTERRFVRFFLGAGLALTDYHEDITESTITYKASGLMMSSGTISLNKGFTLGRIQLEISGVDGEFYRAITPATPVEGREASLSIGLIGANGRYVQGSIITRYAGKVSSAGIRQERTESIGVVNLVSDYDRYLRRIPFYATADAQRARFSDDSIFDHMQSRFPIPDWGGR